MDNKEYIGTRYNVFDGYVELVDIMGDDSAIVAAARRSTDGVARGDASDARLINYMMKNGHSSPFESVEYKFNIEAPITVARQWFRHRTASYNEYSGRYSQMKDKFYVIGRDRCRLQNTSMKQCSGELMDDSTANTVINIAQNAGTLMFDVYNNLLDLGLAKESARNVLPLTTYTSFQWKLNLHNLFHFLKLRLDKHAQEEIRKYAQVIEKMVSLTCPAAYEAFLEHKLYAKTLSCSEHVALSEYLAKHNTSIEEIIKGETK